MRDSETQNDYFGARFHQSNFGRFMSADPGPIIWTDPQSANRYSYVRNNPLNHKDPTGKYFVVSSNDSHYGQIVAAIHDMMLTPTGRAAFIKIATDSRPSIFMSGTIEQTLPLNHRAGLTVPIPGGRPGQVVAGTKTTLDFSQLAPMHEAAPQIDTQGKDTVWHETSHVLDILGAATAKDLIAANAAADKSSTRKYGHVRGDCRCLRPTNK